MTDAYPTTDRTSGLRLRERIRYDRHTVHAVLDEALVGHLGFVVDGEPRILPTLVVRVGEAVYVHGSTGSRPLLAARDAAVPVCLTVTLLDGLVLARSQFHHSANYRSVVVHSRAELVDEETEKRTVLTALVDKLVRGRAADTRPPSDKELAQTALLRVPLTEVSAKVRTGPSKEEPEDLNLPHWAGVLPLRLVAGIPEPDEEGSRVPLPRYLRPYLHGPSCFRAAS